MSALEPVGKRGAVARCVGVLAFGLAMLLGAAVAGAQASGDRGGDAAATPNAGSPLPGGGTTKDLTMPGQGGVADTGLGGSTNGTGNGAVGGRPSPDTAAAGVSGTGESVKGSAGQGIDGQGTSNGITAGPASGGSGAAATGAAGSGNAGSGGTAAH